MKTIASKLAQTGQNKNLSPLFALPLMCMFHCSVDLKLDREPFIQCEETANCPEDSICALGPKICVLKTSTCISGNDAELSPVENGRECSVDKETAGICLDGVCLLTRCGDGVLSEGEACDVGDGNFSFIPDACRINCILPSCGDGVQDSGEECDLGESNGDNGQCTNECTQNICGDGFRGVAEECDDGDTDNLDGCLNDCRRARCGDNFIRAGVEQCDDGNTVSGDGCSECSLPECGNGATEGQEQCDDGNSIETDNCLNTCFRNTCGDGQNREIGPNEEECDEGASNGDGLSECTTQCTLNICGDGYLKSDTEACDDRQFNGIPGQPCTFQCTLNSCGDGHVGPIDPSNPASSLEECDLGAPGSGAGLNDDNGESGSACTVGCILNACGDMHIGPGEECDLGPQNGVMGEACTSDCQDNVCGDGHTGGLEACDNGNDTGNFGNACSPTCTNNVCGDEHIGPAEECDFGSAGSEIGAGNDNGESGSACTGACQLNICGDSHVGPGEQCDDGNSNNNDGCSAGCQNESFCVDLSGLNCPSGATQYCRVQTLSCSDGDDLTAEAICAFCRGAACTLDGGPSGCCGDSTSRAFTQASCTTHFVYSSGCCGTGTVRREGSCSGGGSEPNWCPLD